MTAQLDLFASRRLRDAGIATAASHADAVNLQWQELAHRYLLLFVRRGSTFVADDVRRLALQDGLPEAPDPRAWGAVLMRAAKAGTIRKVGYQASPNPVCHCRPTAVWTAA